MVKAQLSPQKKNPPTRRTKRSHKRLVIHRALEHEYGHRNGNRHREWSQSNFLSKKITHQLGELNTLTKDLQFKELWSTNVVIGMEIDIVNGQCPAFFPKKEPTNSEN